MAAGGERAPMTQSEMLIQWLVSFFASLTMVAGKVGYRLFSTSETEPTDPVQALHWKRRRWWLAFSEFSAVPAFATLGVSSTIYWHLPTIASVLISMALGALGFGFLLHALQFVVRQKLKMEDPQ